MNRLQFLVHRTFKCQGRIVPGTVTSFGADFSCPSCGKTEYHVWDNCTDKLIAEIYLYIKTQWSEKEER